MENKFNKKEADLINKLVEINHDRTEGYSRAADETEDADIKALFNKHSRQSSEFSSELTKRVSTLGEKPVEGTSASGKVYRAWMDVKSALTSKDRKAILGSCEFGEDVAVSAYRDVLEEKELSPESRILVERQMSMITAAHDEIRNLRDTAKA